MLGAKSARERHFLGNGVAIDIEMVIPIGLEAEQPILPDLHDALGTGKQADHQGTLQCLERGGHRHAGHERYVGGLHAAIGQIDRGRRLGRAGYSHQNHLGMFQVLGVLTVVVEHGEIQRIDALEIFGIERVLGADAGRRFRSEVGLKQAQDRTEDIEIRHAEFPAFRLQPLQKLAIEQGVEHNPGRGFHLVQHSVELSLAADQRVNVLDRRHGDVLGGRRTGDRDQRLAGRIRNEMEVEIASGTVRHAKPGKRCG